MIRATVLGIATCLAASAQGETLRVLNWDEYIEPSVLEDFTAETGIEVVYEEYDDGEVAEALLVSEDVPYDLAVISSEYFGRLDTMGLVRSVDREKLENFPNLDASIMGRYGKIEGAPQASVPYLWGTTGIGYDAAAIAERMPDAPTDSWAMIFDPAVVSRFADCGVSLLDAPEEMTAIALNYLGHDPATSDPDALDEAHDLIAAIVPYVSVFDSEHSWQLIEGEVCLAVGWSGDVLLATEEDEDIVYSIPQEGAPMWFDVFVMPRNGANPEAAYRFIDFILRPEITARITNFVWYPNLNTASLPAVDPEIRENPAVYPSADDMERLFPLRSRSGAEKGAIARAWRRLKLGL